MWGFGGTKPAEYQPHWRDLQLTDCIGEACSSFRLPVLVVVVVFVTVTMAAMTVVVVMSASMSAMTGNCWETIRRPQDLNLLRRLMP